MTDSSCSARSFACGDGCPNRQSRPFSTSWRRYASGDRPSGTSNGGSEAELLAEVGQRAVDLDLPVDAVALHLEQESVLAEDVAERGDRLASPRDVAVDDPARRLALQATGQRDQSL